MTQWQCWSCRSLLTANAAPPSCPRCGQALGSGGSFATSRKVLPGIAGCFSINEDGVVGYEAGFDENDPRCWKHAESLDRPLAALVRRYVMVERAFNEAFELNNRQTAGLVAITRLPGPHFSTAAKSALELARKALQR